MQRKSEKGKSGKKLPKLGLQAGHNGKPGRYYVRLNGQRTYLGYENGTGETPTEVTQRYLEAVLRWEKNGNKPLPTHVKTGISCEELAVKYLKWVATEYRNSKPQYSHCKVAAQLLIDHCGNESVDNITKHTIIALQEKLVENGKPRPSIDRYIGLIKAIFEEGAYLGWGVSEKTADSVSRVRNLKKGRTLAPEYAEVNAIDDAIVGKTLPFMNTTIRAMIQIQRICCMRGQDVRNLRLQDIDMDSYSSFKVWLYYPFKHKGTSRGKTLVKGIPEEAQEILKPFLEGKKPTDFVFQPKESVAKFHAERRTKRKTKVQPSQVKRAQKKNRKTKRAPNEQYSNASYYRGVVRAIERANKAGKKEMGEAWVPIPHWHPHQVRHQSVAETRNRFGNIAARDCAGHGSVKVTNGYGKNKNKGIRKKQLKRIVKVAMKQDRIFSEPEPNQEPLVSE